MVSLGMLWLPILIASVLVFIAGFVLNTLLPYHRTDFTKLPNEDALQEAIRKQNLSQNQYAFPRATTWAEMKNPDYVAKAKAGPVGVLVIWPNGAGPMGMQLGVHFFYVVVISILTAYVTGLHLAPDAEYMSIFRVASVVAWLGYAGAVIPESIWYYRPWSHTWKNIFDGLVYALVTAGALAGFWPS